MYGTTNPLMQVYNQDRIDKISKIMPQFNKVARTGDTVLMGLEGDPSFPFSNKDRPSATIVKVDRNAPSGTQVSLRMKDGSVKSVNEYSIAPNEVWEYSDASFVKVMDRERAANEQRMLASRAERPISEPSFRGDGDLKREVAQLRAELDAERQLTRNFHNTYIASLHELAEDVCKLDSTGKHANFCRTFNQEYEKMRNRAEGSIYRGTYDDDDEGDFDEEEQQQQQQQQNEQYFTESDRESLSDCEYNNLNESDYF